MSVVFHNVPTFDLPEMNSNLQFLGKLILTMLDVIDFSTMLL
jgi:hypothetical protein